MKSFSSILAWLLMAAVLAVPSFLFYNWWSKSKMQASAEVAPESVVVNVFPQEKSAQSELIPPPSEGQSRPQPSPAPAEAQPAPSARPPAAVPAESAPSASAQAPEAGPIEQPAAQRPAAAEQPAAAERPAAVKEPPAGEAPAEAVAVSTGPKPVSYFEPKGDRDPVLSTMDYRQMKAERMARDEQLKARRMAQLSKAKEAGPETRISLQGIVGSAAIINDNMVSVGQTVRGIKIVKIGADYIIGEYKGKRFRKALE